MAFIYTAIALLFWWWVSGIEKRKRRKEIEDVLRDRGLL